MRFIAVFILSLLLWTLLTFEFSVPNLVVGIIASLMCAIIFARFFVHNTGKLLQPRRYFWFVVYLVVLIGACIKANLDVAYRVLHPSMPIKPGIVKIRTTLHSDLAKTILANSLTMTPGTIAVDIIGEYLYIHWIFVRSEEPEVYTGMITGTFEKYIKRIIE